MSKSLAYPISLAHSNFGLRMKLFFNITEPQAAGYVITASTVVWIPVFGIAEAVRNRCRSDTTPKLSLLRFVLCTCSNLYECSQILRHRDSWVQMHEKIM